MVGQRAQPAFGIAHETAFLHAADEGNIVLCQIAEPVEADELAVRQQEFDLCSLEFRDEVIEE